MGGRGGQKIGKSLPSENGIYGDDYKDVSVVIDDNIVIMTPEIKNALLLAGIPNDYDDYVFVYFDTTDKVTSVVVNTEDFEISRYIDDKKNKIVQSSFKIAKGSKYSGMASDILLRQAEYAMSKGYSKLITHAASDVDYNGGYTWLRLGYKPLAKDNKRIVDYANRNGFNIRSATTLMRTSEGRSFMVAQQFSYNAEFILKSKGYSMTTLRNYVSQKRRYNK